MAILGKHGISANTPGAILLGAGTIRILNLKATSGLVTVSVPLPVVARFPLSVNLLTLNLTVPR